MTGHSAVDQEARNMATAAVAKIESHELVCAQRWASTMALMGDIKHILAWSAGGLITTLLSIIGWLVTHQPH